MILIRGKIKGAGGSNFKFISGGRLCLTWLESTFGVVKIMFSNLNDAYFTKKMAEIGKTGQFFSTGQVRKWWS